MRTTVKIILISLLMICACSWRTTAKYTWACEDEYTSLDCGSDTIDVKVANYGRTDRKICSTGRPCHRLSNTNCLADNSLSQVKKRCDGRMACTVQASSLLFSDPCVGTYKYLEVLYHCVPPPERSDLTCEGNNGTLNCGSHIIQVQAANYGRTDGTTCADGRDANQTNTTNCLSTNTLSKVKEICEGRTSCEVEALNSIFSNPCPGIHKYLNITYNCVPPMSRHICEGHHSTLECESNVIQIHAATYGRTDGTTCADGRDVSEINNISCLSTNTLSKVKEICEEQKSCKVEASNSIFSNPCAGVHKYLNISYSCVPPRSRHICEQHRSTLECGSNVIQVQAANYGRTDGTTCADGRDANQTNTTNCLSTNTLSKVKEICEGRTSCEVEALNSIFSNPCPGIHKYLNITYNCVPPNSSQTCEGSRSTINCGSDHFIKVHLASYGRTDATICSTSRPANQVTNTNCYSDVLSTVRRECEGMVRCRIPVTNSFLSNPCPGTHKYLDITYSCVPPLSSQICEGNSTILDCGANVISIHTANYGRMDTHTCSAGLPAAAVAERKCFTSTARATLMELCHGMQTCMVTASDDVFQDVCPETYKYLDITYTCVDPASV